MSEIKSIAQLIEMKEEINKKRTEVHTMHVDSLDTDIKFKPASRVDIVKARKMDDTDIDPYMIYAHVIEPDLKDKRLQEAYNKGCQPHEIVDKLFAPAEVGKISLAICGMGAGNPVKTVKN